MDITLTVRLEDLDHKQHAALLILLGATDADKVEIPKKYVANDAEIGEFANDMLEAGLGCALESNFGTPDLFRRAHPDKLWNDLDPGTRKALGRRFRMLVLEQEDEKEIGEKVVVLHTKTIQNPLIYKLSVKEGN